MSLTLEQCTVRPCSALVGVVISRNGGLPKVDATGYSGITDDGEPVCRDHFCPTCGNAHSSVEEFDNCELHGPPSYNQEACSLLVAARS